MIGIIRIGKRHIMRIQIRTEIVLCFGLLMGAVNLHHDRLIGLQEEGLAMNPYLMEKRA